MISFFKMFAPQNDIVETLYFAGVITIRCLINFCI